MVYFCQLHCREISAYESQKWTGACDKNATRMNINTPHIKQRGQKSISYGLKPAGLGVLCVPAHRWFFLGGKTSSGSVLLKVLYNPNPWAGGREQE